MAGFNSITGDESIMYADNASFDGTQRGGKMITDGQVWIGSTVSPHVRLGLPAGQKAYSTPAMQGVYGNGTLLFEDRTWDTPYVVDSNTTVGQRGTFTTIQSAINAIIADGVAGSKYGTVLIRPGTYTENISISSDSTKIHLKCIVPSPASNISQPSVFINGTLGITASTVLLENVGVIGTTTLNSGSLRCYNAYINGLSGNSVGALTCNCVGGQLIDVNITNISLDCRYTELSYSTVFSITNSVGSSFDYCKFITGSANSIALNGTTNAQITNCELMSISGNTSGIVSIQNTGVINTITLNSATLNISGVYLSSGLGNIGGSPFDLTSTNNGLNKVQLQGNVLTPTLTATSYTVLNTDYYVGITSTASPRTMTLPDTSNSAVKPIKNQMFIFKDQSGGAGTNNITISPNGGNIDGGASKLINTNYGSIKVYFDGTNYFSL